MKRRTLVPIAAALALLACALAARAQPAPRAPSRAVAPAPAPQHRYFGSLASANGSALVIRLRNGREVAVDAAEAFALRRVSEPLFRGKPTVVEGTFDANSVLHATAVRRAAPNATAWGNDL